LPLGGDELFVGVVVAAEGEGLGLSVGVVVASGFSVRGVVVVEGGVFAFATGGSKRSNHRIARRSNARTDSIAPVESMAA